MACDVQDATLLNHSAPADWCRRTAAAFPPCRFFSSVFLAWEKSAKRLLSGERYPSRFVIHHFSPCILGDHLFSCPWCSFVFSVHWMCIPRVLMWAGDRALFEPGLCIHVRWRHWKAGCTFALGQDLGAWETEITYTGHLLDSAVLSSDVLFPHILLHLHLWLFEYCQTWYASGESGVSSQYARGSISESGSVSA